MAENAKFNIGNYGVRTLRYGHETRAISVQIFLDARGVVGSAHDPLVHSPSLASVVSPRLEIYARANGGESVMWIDPLLMTSPSSVDRAYRLAAHTKEAIRSGVTVLLAYGFPPQLYQAFAPGDHEVAQKSDFVVPIGKAKIERAVVKNSEEEEEDEEEEEEEKEEEEKEKEEEEE
ncbi:hypothetical protein FN846DRAFT_914655 [Sphaerosporella brunnea]|uniref:Uncharacterized protein n=1 Tax=Sphaerosporella brunnea TaxID=1250544 RepID=A0A5J5EBN4_9PEZI|nr:hypothetical protein FN846DRAFT_914655 [Sphaerosporella brunnea]